jgi:hypothetical protein
VQVALEFHMQVSSFRWLDWIFVNFRLRGIHCPG